MSNWNCDGTPKDGKTYSGLGGTHEPHENYSADCEICGLPKTSQTPFNNNFLSKILPFAKNKFGFLTVAIFLMSGGGLYGFKTFSSGDRYLETYAEALKTGEQGMSLVRTHSTPEELQQAQEYLTLAISDLNKISEDASMYSEIKQTIDSYDGISTQITNKLNNFELCVIEPRPDSCLF